ncbi:MAG: threonine--tRNA ligase [Planctomycetes bacterium]|nr:threonine--tRNA ligase [Planctomycetota bacterium]
MKVRLPDGKELAVGDGATAAQVALAIGPRLAKAALGAMVNGELRDAFAPIPEGAQVRILTDRDEEAVTLQRHTLAHMMAQAVEEKFAAEGHPRGVVKLGIGPVIENGFYYDFDLPRPLREEDLEDVSRRMEEIRKKNLPLRKYELPRQEAIERFEKLGDPYKVELIHAIPPGDPVTFYEQGGETGFTDLCRGPHVPRTGACPPHFRLMSVAGAYWRGSEKNPMLQRIYAVAFRSKEELDEHLRRLEEARRRDHKKLGKELRLFATDAEIGPGLPLWLPRGAAIRRALERYIVDLEIRRGYDHVYTPQMAKLEVYKQSGHWAHYKDSMFPIMEIENDEFVLRPMNCPHHFKVYKQDLHSYRDLPVRIAELGTMYRYEKSGELAGLSRVRAMTLNDAHIFCRPDQIAAEFRAVVEMILDVYRLLGFEDFWFRLSLRDPANTEKFVAGDAMWDLAEDLLVRVLDEIGHKYVRAPGEAAFYGPKLDVQVPNVLGHDETISTVQLDFHFPKAFDIEFVAQDGNRARPVVIHRGVISTFERIVAFLIEAYAGEFPVWLAPEQVRIVPITDDHLPYARALRELLLDRGLRSSVDERPERMQAKIRDAELLKVPYIAIVGAKEVEGTTVSFRSRREENANGVPRDLFVQKIADLDRTRAR